MNKPLLLPTCLLISATALAAPPRNGSLENKAQPRPSPCQGDVSQGVRDVWPNGTLLWGNHKKVDTDETSTELASVGLKNVHRRGRGLRGLLLQEGRLIAPSQSPNALIGSILEGSDSDGQPVQVAICSAEPAPKDPSMVWHRIEVWDGTSATWKNPCVATDAVSSPRALAVEGVWDKSGARQTSPGRFTFACENGAIAKCIGWGYKPWTSKDGTSLEDTHQACTRMARADYCGNGRSHTRENTLIDVYDSSGVLARTTQPSASWMPEQASFEAAWTPEGAACLARTRDGEALQAIVEECPTRFDLGAVDLGEGDHCTLSSQEAFTGPALLRNRSYDKSAPASLSSLTARPARASHHP